MAMGLVRVHGERSVESQKLGPSLSGGDGTIADIGGPNEMSLRFIPFDPQHLHTLRLHRGQPETCPNLADLDLSQIPSDRKAWTETLLKNNKPLACFGVIPQADCVGVAWALYGEGFAPARSWAAPRLIQRLQSVHDRGIDRIYTVVRMDFPYAHRFAARLGFEFESQACDPGPDGADYGVCVRYGAASARLAPR